MLLGGGRGGRRRYDEFVARLTGERLLPLFTKYPVLARLVALAVQQWVGATGEFLERLSLDGALVSELASAAADRVQTGTLAALPVTRIRPGLSDFHHGGRTVLAVYCGAGPGAVYKPRGLATEFAFNQFLAWCVTDGISPSLRPVRCVDRGSYGWEECIDYAPCGSPAERGRFYERAGALLCVLHALRGTDCHRDNLVACGEFPVLVDGETVMQPEVAVGDGSAVTREDADFVDSVVRTGLLPRWYVNPDKRLVLDISALGGTAHDQAPVPRGSGTRSTPTTCTPFGRPSAFHHPRAIPAAPLGPLVFSNNSTTSSVAFDRHTATWCGGASRSWHAVDRSMDSKALSSGTCSGPRWSTRESCIARSRPSTLRVESSTVSRSMRPRVSSSTRRHTKVVANTESGAARARAHGRPVLPGAIRLETSPAGQRSRHRQLLRVDWAGGRGARIQAMNDADLNLQTTIIRGAFAARVATETPTGRVFSRCGRRPIGPRAPRA